MILVILDGWFHVTTSLIVSPPSKLVSPIDFSSEDGGWTPIRIPNAAGKRTHGHFCKVNIHLAQWGKLGSLAIDSANAMQKTWRRTC